MINFNNRRAKKLDSELKYLAIKKLFRIGYADKDPNAVKQVYAKESDETNAATYGPALPKASKALRNNDRMLKLVNSLDNQFKSNLNRIMKKSDTIAEVDCCICFHHTSTDTNPIIYCSGYLFKNALNFNVL